MGAFLVLLKTLNKFDLIMLIHNFETSNVNNIIEVLMGIVVGNSNKLQKGVWKENLIECIQTWANDIRVH
jgi:hypothetical protein